ncbi:MAG: MoaD/ThiS family protein [Planctomycetota bacterium]
MQVRIKLPANMRALADDIAEHKVQATTVGEALNLLCEQHSDLQSRLLSEEGKLQPFVNVFLDGTNVRELEAELTELKKESEILIVAALAGG